MPAAVPPRSSPPPVRRLALLGDYFPLLLITGALVWASISIALRRTAEDPPNIKTIRIAHYQLETGVREGFAKMAAEYHRLHPDVQIIQEWVPSNTYGQWLSTQLISGHPADILEVGGVSGPIGLSYASRYYLPLTDYVQRPNPYNAGTDLERTPWLETYFDHMKLSRVPELQQYIHVPLAQFGVRVLYNKDLLKKLTGLDAPPARYGDFIAACDRIKSQHDDQGRSYIPLAGSATHFAHWAGSIATALTFPLIQTLDFNHDGYSDNREVFVAFKAGLVSMTSPAMEAKYRVLRQLSEECQPGFIGTSRDEAVFLFIQQRAVFMSAGSWDALTLMSQAKGNFEIGVTDFPHPTDADPGFAGLAPMPAMEIPMSNFCFDVTRASKHPAEAIDFLQFLSGRQNNQEFNRIIGWIPCISGTEPGEELKAFAPRLKGIMGVGEDQWAIGGATGIRWGQLQSLYFVNQLSYADFAAQYTPYYVEHGLGDFQESLRDTRRALPTTLRGDAGQRARALDAPTPQAADLAWMDYVNSVADRTCRDVDTAREVRYAESGFPAGQTPPGRYSPAALETIRRRLQAPPAAPPGAASPLP